MALRSTAVVIPGQAVCRSRPSWWFRSTTSYRRPPSCRPFSPWPLSSFRPSRRSHQVYRLNWMPRRRSQRLPGRLRLQGGAEVSSCHLQGTNDWMLCTKHQRLLGPAYTPGRPWVCACCAE